MSLATLNDPRLQITASPYVGRLADEVMNRFGKASPRFDGDGLQILERLLEFAANAEQQLAEQRRQIAELEAKTRTDVLTGLLNRRGFEEALSGVIASARRHNEEGIICYVDLDRFKAINDTHGHQAGDEVLRQVADVLAENVRADDTVARVGGDEFVVILSRITLTDGLKKAKRLQRSLHDMVVDIGPTLSLEVSASIGIQCYNADTDIGRVMAEADSAMYADKARRSKAKRLSASASALVAISTGA